MKTRVIQDDPEQTEDLINRQAPVIGTSEIEIVAAPTVVWGVLTDIEEWPRWNSDVKCVSMQGGLAEGSAFRWKAGPGTITSVLQTVEPPRRIAWSGKTLGIQAMHVYALEARNGTTLVRTEESYDGLIARLFRGSLQKTLSGSLESGLRQLKAESERRTTHPAERRS
jgi:hypothetical protein